jgi:DNA-binding phage protein
LPHIATGYPVFLLKGPKMVHIDKLKEVLALMNLSAVSRGAGVPVYVLQRFVNGTSMPRFDTMQRVVDFLTSKGVILG